MARRLNGDSTTIAFYYREFSGGALLPCVRAAILREPPYDRVPCEYCPMWVLQKDAILTRVEHVVGCSCARNTGRSTTEEDKSNAVIPVALE